MASSLVHWGQTPSFSLCWILGLLDVLGSSDLAVLDLHSLEAETENPVGNNKASELVFQSCNILFLLPRGDQ